MQAMQYRLKTRKNEDSEWNQWTEWRYLETYSSWTGIGVDSFAFEYRTVPYSNKIPAFTFPD